MARPVLLAALPGHLRPQAHPCLSSHEGPVVTTHACVGILWPHLLSRNHRQALAAHMCSSTAVPPETVTCQHPSPTPWRCLISPHAPSQRPRGISPHLYRLFRTAFKGHPFMRSTSCPPPAGGPSQYSHARQARPHSPRSPGPGITAVLQGGRTRGCSRRSLSAPCTSFPPPASSRRSASQRSASCSAASAA